MKNEIKLFLTKTAIKKIKHILKNQKNTKLKLRIYINGGGCSGFKYGFKLDDKIDNDDILITQSNIIIIIDHISLQYLTGSSLDYLENVYGSKFTISNPNAKTTCSCGESFGI
ncbi:Iron-sulfur cluster insertion protein ErpA [Buchnera aphidicola (Neophyllaphis podocarpi)]|uniref:iron-sulfur cluster insertion protein ErpA n=1 Tax=Buchnera aphidicola TaxID=9 RepID=UPI0031B8311A